MAPRRSTLDKALATAAAAAFGQWGGHARAAKLSAAKRSAIAKKAGLASGGWPKGKKRGPSPLTGRTVVGRKKAVR